MATVAGLDELATQVQALESDLVFRGQDCPHANMFASAFRPGNEWRQSCAIYEHAKGQIEQAVHNAWGVQTDLSNSQLCECLFQHYDHISIGLDLTSDLYIAIWFALHKFVPDEPRVFDVGHHRVRIQLRRIERRQSGEGVIYAFRREGLQKYGLAELSTLIQEVNGCPESVRPGRQHALLTGLIHQGRHDYLEDVAAAFSIPCGEQMDPALEGVEPFPPRHTDPILDALLCSCFTIVDDSENDQPQCIDRWISPLEFQHDGPYTPTQLQGMVAPERVKRSEIALAEDHA